MALETLKIEGSPQGVREAARAFDAFSGLHHLPDSVRQAAQVALDEVLSNVAKAGFEAGEPRGIDLSFEVSGRNLEIAVSYNGVAFDPLARKDPDTKAALEDRPVGGLGIYLVKSLMDGVQYERTGDTNRLCMTKRIPE